MRKKSQIAIFIILGLVILMIVSLVVYLVNSLNEKKLIDAKMQLPFEFLPIENFVSNCIERTSVDILRIAGKQGGYIGMGYEQGKDDENKVSTFYHGIRIPYYYADNTLLPRLEEIEVMVEKEIKNKIIDCLNFTSFEKEFIIEKPKDFDVDVKINNNDITVELIYPVYTKRGDKAEWIQKFRKQIPINIGSLYETAKIFVEKVKNSEQAYDMSYDCNLYDTNGKTNVYVKESDSFKNEIIQFMDYSTFYYNYFETFRFQFAIKDIEIKGECS